MTSCAPVTELKTKRLCACTSWPLRNIRLLRRVATAVLLALVTILVSTAPAEAVLGKSNQPPCDNGVFCAWPKENYEGTPHLADLRTVNLNECIPFPPGVDARSIINRTDRPVTVYQGVNCSTEGDFVTYPTGSFVPSTPFVVRAIQIWPH